MSVEAAMKVLGVGPRGGDLNNPVQMRERRTAPFSAQETEDGPLLHRFERPEAATMGLLNEQPWHRMAAFLLLAGKSNGEIADAAGVSPQQVCIVKSQAWFQELLGKLANSAGQDVLGLIQSEAVASVNVLVEIRDDQRASKRDRLQAATTILEQGIGKPTQKVLSAVTHIRSIDPRAEADEIQAEINALRARQAKIE